MAKQHPQHEKSKAQDEPEVPAPAEAAPVEETPAEAAAEMLRRMND